MGAILAWLGVTDPAMQERVIIGIFGFAGVIVTGLIAIATWSANQLATRRAERRLRREKSRDVRTALLAEVEAIYWQHTANERAAGGFERLQRSVRERFAAARQSGKDYSPYVTAETGAMVFAALEEDISILEDAEIRPVVQFYRQIALMEKFAEELKTDRFYSLDLDRKERMTLDYVRMVRMAVRLGDAARIALADSLGVPLRDGPFLPDDPPSRTEPDQSPPASPAAASPDAGQKQS